MQFFEIRAISKQDPFVKNVFSINLKVFFNLQLVKRLFKKQRNSVV